MATRPRTISPGVRLRLFREGLGLSLREAARQLHCTHPALRDWESNETPTAVYRDAVEVWTGGRVKASEWPLEGREKELAAAAGAVKPATPAPAKATGTDG